MEIQRYRKKSNRITSKKTKWSDFQTAVYKELEEDKERYKSLTVEELNTNLEQSYQEFIRVIIGAVNKIREGN